ncbi:MAG: hypothetical protein A2X99_06985 [Deltaproteobacteria bacterium GWB2_55_19]|nr:MAG: hypothetical protein A2X99_06985 [Deltaproteobacteria bacterium GWB2_55_19]HAO92987.1 hypothetical protein [Deltaproteobacteria bacterium]
MIFVLFHQYKAQGGERIREAEASAPGRIRRLRSKGRASGWGRKEALGAPADKRAERAKWP